MWEIVEQGIAEFRTNGWKLVVASGEPHVGGIRLLACREEVVGATARIAVSDYSLPSCDECYIRGDALHLSFSLSDEHPIGLEVVLMAIEADQQVLAVESVVGIHTWKLDSHPSLVLELGSGHPGFPVWGGASWERLADQREGVWMRGTGYGTVAGPRVSTQLLCDHRDLDSLQSTDTEGASSVQFFGDFLEKGVIRKVQPWWVWSTGQLPRERLARLAGNLARRPLALSN